MAKRRRGPAGMDMLDGAAGFSSMDKARTPSGIRKGILYMGVALAVYLVAIAVMPWQQFVRGSGRVIAYNPLDRPLTLEAPLKGRVARSEVVEGQVVKRGQILFQMVDNDPNLLANLRSQRTALELRVDAARNTVRLSEARLFEVRRSVEQSIEAAEAKLEAAEVAATTAEQQFVRIEALYTDPRGLASERDYELALLSRNKTAADLRQARADLEKAQADGRASVQSAEASLESSRASLASAEQSLTSLDISINQTQTQEVVAPRDGVVVRVLTSEGEFLSAGSPLAVIVPETSDRMAELMVAGNDVPLVRAREVDEQGNVVARGTPVRLQFEGWPAVQFVGWPSVARGTFAGEVVAVDATDNGKGQFRVLVAPRPDTIRRRGEDVVEDWPGPRFLRQGTRVNGWLLLRRVPLWFEVWRQLNGFPPALDQSPENMNMAGGA